jgi:hypothetical protein
MSTKYGDKSFFVRDEGDGFIWCDISFDLPDISYTVSAKLPKKDYSLSELRKAVYAKLLSTIEGSSARPIR